MKRRNHSRPAFRPDVDIARLEDRVVLSGPGDGVSHLAAVHAAPAQVSSFASGGQTPPGSSLTQLSRRQLLSMYAQQFRVAASDLKHVIDSQVGQIYAGGRPSQDQLNNLETLVIGAVDATAF